MFMNSTESPYFSGTNLAFHPVLHPLTWATNILWNCQIYHQVDGNPKQKKKLPKFWREKNTHSKEKLIARSKLLITVVRKRCYFIDLFKAAKTLLETLIKSNYICNLNTTNYFIFSSSSFISQGNSFLVSARLGWLLLAFIIYHLEWFKCTFLKQKKDKWSFFLSPHTLVCFDMQFFTQIHYKILFQVVEF